MPDKPARSADTAAPSAADMCADDVRFQMLDRLGDWRLQMGIWKYAVQGEVIEPDALIAEHGDPQFSHCGFWDQTRADLAGATRDRGRGWEPVPDWWALFHLPMSWREEALDAELR